MNSNRETDNGNEFLEDIEMDDLRSVDDFFKELEAKEKDLHISSDLVIEVEDSEYDERDIPDYTFLEPPVKAMTPVQQVYGAAAHKQPESNARYEIEISELKGRIAKMEGERIEIVETSQRRARDFENYKNRTERDRQDNFLNQVSTLATEVLPVLDNLDRALEFAAQIQGPEQKDFKQFYDGIVLVNKQLNEVMAEMGLLSIPAVGENFDPHFHEAVAIDEDTEQPANVVTSELLKGYRIGDRVVRAAMVKVSAGRKAAPLPPLAESEEPAELPEFLPELLKEELAEAVPEESTDDRDPNLPWNYID